MVCCLGFCSLGVRWVVSVCRVPLHFGSGPKCFGLFLSVWSSSSEAFVENERVSLLGAEGIECLLSLKVFTLGRVKFSVGVDFKTIL